MNHKSYWNSVAETKEFTTPFDYDMLNKYLSKDASIVDVGCGYGRTMAELSNKGYQNISGLDISEKMIERGKRIHPDLKFNVMKENQLSFANNSIDTILLFAVLTCIENNQDQNQLIQEIRRVLKPNGIIVINDFLLNDDQRNRNRYYDYHKSHPDTPYGVFQLGDGGICRHHSKKHFEQLLDNFSKRETKFPVFKTMNDHTSKGIHYIGHA